MNDLLGITYSLLKIWDEKRGSSSVLRRSGTFKKKEDEEEVESLNNDPVIPNWMPEEMKKKINDNYEKHGHNDMPEWLPENYQAPDQTVNPH